MSFITIVVVVIIMIIMIIIIIVIPGLNARLKYKLHYTS